MRVLYLIERKYLHVGGVGRWDLVTKAIFLVYTVYRGGTKDTHLDEVLDDTISHIIRGNYSKPTDDLTIYCRQCKIHFCILYADCLFRNCMWSNHDRNTRWCIGTGEARVVRQTLLQSQSQTLQPDNTV
jgi:hypothetical protein